MASNNPADYIHPIIQAYVQGQQLEQSRLQQEEAKRKNLEQEKIDREAMKQRAELAQQANDLDKTRLDLLLKQHSFESKAKGFESLSKAIAGGAKPQPSAIPGTFEMGPGGVSVQQGIQDPLTGNQYDPSLFPTLENIISGKAQEAGAITQSQAQARAPFEQEQDLRQGQIRQTLQRENEASDLLRTREQIQSQEKIAQMRDATDRFTAQVAARTRLALGGSENEGIVQSFINDAYITGNKPVPVKYEGVVRSNLPKDWTPISKGDANSLDVYPTIQRIADLSKQLAEYSYDGPKGGIGSTGKLAIGVGPAKVIKDELDNLAGQLARYEGVDKGAFSNKDREYAQSRIFRLGSSYKDNLSRAAEIEDYYRTKLSGNFAKYPEDQKSAILSNREIDPSKLSKSTPKRKVYNPKTGKIEEQ